MAATALLLLLGVVGVATMNVVVVALMDFVHVVATEVSIVSWLAK